MDVMKLRSHVKSDEVLGVLSVLAHDLSSFDFDSFNFYAPKVLFILVNNYTDESLHLGSGPISDAVVAASFHRYLNYQVYFLHNPAPEVFAQWLQKILLYTTENLTIYYSGRRTEVFDYDDEKSTALNELLLFDNGYILDEDLRVLLKRYPKGKETKVLLVSDIYESGSVWFIPPSVEKAEIEYYSNIVSISTLHKDLDHVVPAEKIHYQGLFTFLLFASARFSGSLVPNEIQIYLAPLLNYYQLDVELYVTKKELREEPVLPFAQ
uniref:Clan CD family C14 metacaspase-like cysteine peptidase n=1 Tax=Coptotermes formosanus TaxID=36987 RepID=R4UX26_COPFO|nr:clan CD family C14 metacaspase-like cysteine peptidase [Coptotermes formosanus]